MLTSDVNSGLNFTSVVPVCIWTSDVRPASNLRLIGSRHKVFVTPTAVFLLFQVSFLFNLCWCFGFDVTKVFVLFKKVNHVVNLTFLRIAHFCSGLLYFQNSLWEVGSMHIWSSQNYVTEFACESGPCSRLADVQLVQPTPMTGVHPTCV